MESLALLALFLAFLGYALRMKEQPAPEGIQSVLLHIGLVTMGLTILLLFGR